MESINFIRGYGKVTTSSMEDPNPNPKPTNHTRRSILLAILLVLVLVTASIIAAAIIHTNTKPNPSSQLSSNSPSADEYLKTVCSVTRYPDTCISTISPLLLTTTNNHTPTANNSPLRFLNLSLHVSALQVSTLKNMTDVSSVDPAVDDCKELLDDASGQLDRSADLLRVGGDHQVVLTETVVSDLLTWISAAMTDQDTCLDGVGEVGSRALAGEFKVRVQRSQECMSNTLAILNNIRSLYQKFGLTMP